MTWNWQQPDWPEFTWRQERLKQAEERFLVGGGVILGAVSHLDDEGRERLTVEAMSEAAVTSSEIEGELLDRDSVQSSIRRRPLRPVSAVTIDQEGNVVVAGGLEERRPARRAL